MANWPCRNTSCHSYGTPHPNCKCQQPLSKGGDAQHFCSTARSHKPDCEYFAEGGEITEEAIPYGFHLEETPSTEDPMPDEASDEEAIPEGFHLEEPKPLDTTEDKVLAGYIGGLKGIIGPLVEPLIKENPLIFGSVDTVNQREKENPGIAHGAQAATTIGGLLLGTGAAGAAAKASEAVTGSKVLQQAIQGGLITANDETTKWIMGQGDPEGAAGALSAIGASAIFSGMLGGVGAVLGKAGSAVAKKAAESKFGEEALSFLHGLGTASKTQNAEELELAEYLAKKAEGVNMGAYKKGVAYFDKLISDTAGAIGGITGFFTQGLHGIPLGAAAGKGVGSYANRLGGKWLMSSGGKYAGPAMLKVLSSGSVRGAAEAFDHAAKIAHGSQVIDKAVQSFFKPGPALTSQAIGAYGGRNLKEDLDTFLGNGGMTQSLQQEIYDQNGTDEPQGMAAGGEVHKTPKPQKDTIPGALSVNQGVSEHYPEHNQVLSTARGRISNYLMTLKPEKHPAKLPFDADPDTRQKKKAYDRALHVAVSPMSVMHEIQRGTLDADQVKHMVAMYPELTNLLQKKLTTAISEAQVKGEKPPYKVRQGLSLLMGAALSSEMTPQAIQAAQSVFLKSAPPPPSGQSARKSGGDTSKLSKGEQSFLTGPQAREKRAQRPS